MMIELDDLTERVLALCDSIPQGQVASYGDVGAGSAVFGRADRAAAIAALKA